MAADLICIGGDSIRMGYDNRVEALMPATTFFYNPANDQDMLTLYGHLDTYLAYMPTIFHLNATYHDAVGGTTDGQYEARLRDVLDKLLSVYRLTIVWALGTPVDNPVDDARVVELNTIATNVINSYGNDRISINDLYQFSVDNGLVRHDGVHFIAADYQQIAIEVQGVLTPLLRSGSMPLRYGNSRFYRTIQVKPANVYVNDTNVPVCLSEADTVNVPAGAYRNDGGDIVVTDANGDLILREIATFNQGAATMQLWYRDPVQNVATGGTELYLQWGGSDVNEANNPVTWFNNFGGAAHCQPSIHCEETAANLTDSSEVYTAADANMVYNQAGQIDGAAGFNGTNSLNSWGDVTALNDKNSRYNGSGYYSTKTGK